MKARPLVLVLRMIPLVLWATALLSHGQQTHQNPAFMTGVDANYSQEMAKSGAVWKVAEKPVDLFAALHTAGVDSFRVRVWTVASGSCSTNAAIAVAKQAQAAGLKPYLVFFLSENWADYVKQPAPTPWVGLAFAEKLVKVEEYCKETARAFQQAGITTNLYEIGNEIDFGICGTFEEKWENRFNIAYMNQNIWPKEAQIIRAAENGIRSVNPKAQFILNITQWWNPDYCVAFLEAMTKNGATADFVGLSFYPSASKALGTSQQTFADLGANTQAIAKKTGRQVILCETGYPSQSSFTGQFATWNQAVPGYPLTPEGQQKWLADALDYCRSQPQIRGFFYWSPEWYSDMWQAFAVFDANGNARPALNAFK